MRHNVRKSSKNRGGPKKNIKTRVFESNGPDAKIRGTAYQVTEKYEALAKDADTSGNYVLAENYRQHAEHYQRIINDFEGDMKATAAKVEKEKKPQAAQSNEESANEGTVNVSRDISTPQKDVVKEDVKETAHV